MAKKTLIRSNGSKLNSELNEFDPGSIDGLISVLEREPLDPAFEKIGNFIIPCENDVDGLFGGFRFFGNFLAVSRVFDIITTDDEVKRKLVNAIRGNQNRFDYINARQVAA